MADTTTHHRVTFTLPGSVVSLLAGSAYPNENPREWQTVRLAPTRRVGRGSQNTVSLPILAAADLADCLRSQLDVAESMTASERDGQSLGSLRSAIARIDKAVERELQR